MIVENLLNSINRGRQGLNIGLNTGLSKLDQLTYGLQRQWLTVIAADSGSGKSTFALYTQVYQPFMQHCIDPTIDIHFLLFSFEMNAEVLLTKLLSLYIYDTYNIVLSYKDILSLTNTLDDTYYQQYIEPSIPWLNKFESICEIIDKPVTAKGLYAICKEWSRKYGTYIELNTQGDYVKEEYRSNNSQQYLIVVVDHIKLLALSPGHTVKQEIDEASDFLIYFRNKCGFTITIIQQLNRNFKSMERRNSNVNYIGLEDLSDSGGPAQSAETVIAIYNPWREKLSRCEGYDIRQLGDKARMVQLLKNRFGVADQMEMAAFYGEIGLWKELPRPDQINDYSIYTNL